MTQPTKEAKTKSGKTFKYFGWLTRFQAREIEASLFDSPELSEQQVGLRGEQTIVEKVIIEIDGSTDIWETYGNLPNDEAAEILQKATEVFQREDKKK